MSPLEPSAFIAHPLSTAKDLPSTERLVQQFRDAFAGRGWRVRPHRDDSVAALNASLRTGGGASLVTRNIEGIVTSDLLLVIATEMDEPSSVWVEAGVALARGVPLVVLTTPAVTLPFLVRAALASGADTTGGSLRRRPLAASIPIPTMTTTTHQVQAVGDLVDSIIANH